MFCVHIQVLAYSLSQGRSGVTAMKTRSPTPLALSSSGAFAATIDRHSLYVFRAGVDVTQPLNLHHTQPYTVSHKALGQSGRIVGTRLLSVGLLVPDH